MTRPQPARPARRRSPLGALLLTGVLATGAVAGATALFSARAQDTTEDFARKLTTALNASGVVSAQQTGYQKGLTESKQTMTLTISDDKLGKPVRLLVTNHIKHGPFPGLQGVGQAIVDTEVKFEDPQVQAQFDKAFGGKKPTIRTLIGLGGETSTDLQMPSGTLTEDGGTVAWQALSGNIKVSGSRTSMNFSWPGLTLKSEEASGEISGLSLVGDSSRQNAQDQLGQSTSSFKIAKISMTTDGEPFSMIGSEMSSDSRLSDPNFYDAVVKYNIGELEAGGQKFKNLQLHLGLRHLAREPLNRIMTLINEQQNSTKAASSESPFSDAQLKQLEQDGMALLKGGPRLTLDRLSLTQPSGDILLTGHASAPGLAQASAKELKLLSEAPQLLATMLELHLEAQAPEPAMRELFSAVGGEESGDGNAAVQGLIDEGYMTRQGNQLKAVLDFKDGQPTLNGRPLE